MSKRTCSPLTIGEKVAPTEVDALALHVTPDNDARFVLCHLAVLVGLDAEDPTTRESPLVLRLDDRRNALTYSGGALTYPGRY
jgi:hypothetical protein